jgi:hypothetical protein
MKTNSNFQETLLDCLASTNYVLLNPASIRSTTFDILFNKEELQPMLDSMNEMADLANISVSSSFKSSKVILKFQDDSEMVVNFVYKFTHKSLIYLDEKEVMNKRVKELEGFYIPCVEHLFEHWVLKSFLELKGIGKLAFNYFNEFHILVQEDLLDYFNIKYGTSFSNLYQLTDFDEIQRIQIISKLKNTPSNQFLKKANVRWHNFLGVMRQARII